MLCKVVLVEIAREHTLSTLENSQVNNVIEVDVAHLHTFIVVSGLDNFIGSWIHLYIAMIAAAFNREDGVALDELVLINRHRLALIKLQHFFFIIALHESHNVAVLITELKHMRQLFDDGVAHIVDAMQDQCVGKDLEANRNAGGVRIVNGVALNPKGRVLAIGINPDALQQLLGLGVFLLLLTRFCRGFILTGNNTEHEYTTQHQQKRSGNYSFSYNKPIHSFTYLNMT